MKKTDFLTLILAFLTACGPASPLLDRQSIKISGKILEADGTPYKEAPVTVQTSKNIYPLTTDATGQFQTAILGFEAKGGFGEVVPLTISAKKESGQSVSARPQITTTEHQLPVMRFWNGLITPENGEVIKQDVRFQWEKPATEQTESFTLDIDPADGFGTFWRQDASVPFLSLPLTLFEGDKSYNWRVTASLAQYKATSDRKTFRSDSNAGKTLKISSIIDNKGESYSRLHDGSYSFGLVKMELGKEFIIELGGTQLMNWLVGHSDDTNSYRLEVFASDSKNNWKRLNSVSVKGSFLIDLKGETARTLRLVPVLDTWNLVSVSELRVVQ